ncbi:MAG: hypothetical protein JWP97_2738 [Labilithrix sp.]|nr:hypothetical protein [Labilithrix sp.]
MIEASLPSGPVLHVPLRRSVDACAFVDELGGRAVGEIVVSDPAGPRGTVFVEGGRICWAAARGLGRRLGELLGARASVPPADMQSMFAACKEQRIPLGEHLVGQGVLSADALREALLQHTIESLGRLCAGDARGAWCPRSGAGYSPRFTFATAELLASIGSTVHARLAARVQPMLATVFDDEGDWGAAFVRTAHAAFPEPIALRGGGLHSATELLRLGKWAASLLDVSCTFSDARAFLALGKAVGARSIVLFREGEAFIAGETGHAGTARILNHRARQRLTRNGSHGDL